VAGCTSAYRLLHPTLGNYRAKPVSVQPSMTVASNSAQGSGASISDRPKLLPMPSGPWQWLQVAW